MQRLIYANSVSYSRLPHIQEWLKAKSSLYSRALIFVGGLYLKTGVMAQW